MLMAMDWISVTILVIVAGVGGIAGYWGRIVQKLESRRDQVYLTDLPAIYSSTIALTRSMELFKKGTSIAQLDSSISEVSKSLALQIFSADVLVFEKKPQSDALLNLYDAIQRLQALVKKILNMPSTEQEQASKDLSLAISGGNKFGIADIEIFPKEMIEQATAINVNIKDRLDRYHSYSWKLTAIIFGLAALLALIEIIKGFF